MTFSPDFDVHEEIDWTSAFTNCGFTREQQAIAATRLTNGLAEVVSSERRITELERELAALRTMVAGLVDHLNDRGAIDMETLNARIASALAKAAGHTSPPAIGPYR